MDDMSGMISDLRCPLIQACRIELDTAWHGEAYCDGLCRLYYIERGRVEITTTRGSFSVQAGEMCLLPAYSVFDYRCPRSAVQHYLHFVVVGAGNVPLFRLCNWHEKLSAVQCASAPGWFARLEDLSSVGGMAAAVERQGLLFNLLAPFVGDYRVDSVGGNSARLLPVLDMLEERLADNVSVSDMAAIAHLERAYFSRVFKAVFGVAPAQYLRQVRLERAADLLRNTDLQLGAVSRRVGFCDEYHLSREFKKYFGLPPGRFRRMKSPG
jgi:AraC-like DNA-binding protein